MQCNVVFSGKFELVICQNLSGGKKEKCPIKPSSDSLSNGKKVKIQEM